VQILAIPELDRYRYVDELLARGARNVAATNSDLAQKAAERLVAKYAKSPFVLDAHFVLATIFEDRKKFTEAKQHLEAAIAINRSDDVVMFARLRLGWLYIRAGDHGSALRELRAIAADPKATHVREAAVDSLISSYVQVARPDGAVQLFDAVDRSRTNEWLRELAGQYHEAGKLDHEAAVLRVVLARDNDKIATCIDRVDLVRALANAPNPTDAELAVGELVAAVPFATSACAPLADDAVGELAWHWHTRAKTEHQKAAAARMWDRASELATTKDRKATALANRALLKR
jgi:tetratricopeptide (TPR) repeat protein